MPPMFKSIKKAISKINARNDESIEVGVYRRLIYSDNPLIDADRLHDNMKIDPTEVDL